MAAFLYVLLVLPPVLAEATENQAFKSSLRFISLTTDSARPVLLTGESGAFAFGLSLATDRAKENHLTWNKDGEALALRVSTLKESGIVFQGADEQILIPIAPDDSGTIHFHLAYTVGSRVRVKEYPLRLEILAGLVDENNTRIEDSGTVIVPVRVETPLYVKVLVLAIIAIAIFLFVVEWVRVDVVAIMMMVSLPLLNLLSSRETFTGLSSNAVVAIIGVMIISAGLNKVGVVSRIVNPVIKAAGGSGSRLMIFVSTLIAFISSVMQNTGAAVLFLPGIRHACRQMKIPISSILMPIGMSAILGGTMTMIGTSPLILLNDILPEGMAKFSLLELTPIGFALLLSGLIYFSTMGKLFLNNITNSQSVRSTPADSPDDEDLRASYRGLEGPFELYVPMNYDGRGKSNTIEGIYEKFCTNIVCMSHNPGTTYGLAPTHETEIVPGTSLCAYGLEKDVRSFAETMGIKFLGHPKAFKDLFNPAVAGVVEAAVSPHSAMIDSTVREIGFRKTFGVTVLALYREGKTYYTDLGDIPLTSGDGLLLHSTWDRFHALVERYRYFTIITPLEVEIQTPRKVTAAVICFLVALAMMLISSFYFQSKPYNPIPLSVCLMTGALGMVLTGVESIQEAYKAVDWRTVFLLGGLIPLGMAVDHTGTAEWLATGIVSALGNAVPPLLFIAVLAVMSSAFCLVISNVGACTLLVPLGVSMACQLGIDPRVAAIVVGLGVSNSFLLPTHQVNALYMGPGDYRTRDYIKIGGVLSIIYCVVLTLMTYFFYL